MTKRATPEPEQEAAPSADLQAAFDESVRARRVRAGISQVELGRRAGIPQTEISQIELGRINLTLKTMSRLAEALDGEVTEMLKRSEDPLKKP